MLGAEFMDEIDCGSFFDTMDDLIDFPADTDIGSGKVDDFPTIWSNPANGFPDSDPIFSGATSNAASDLSAELSVPYEDIVQLEWLSNFVEDSFSGGGMTMNKENLPVKATAAVAVRNQFQTSSPVSVLESSSTTTSSSCNSTSWAGKTLPLIPGPRAPLKAQKARSKRPRPRTFNPRLISPASSLMDNPQPFPAPVTSSDSENVVESEPLKKLDAVATEPKKKKKIKFTMPSAAAADVTMNQNPVPQGAAVRKCLHCEITKTPQWRAGPLGPKTLCNACGVRYKSGRLFPEYRPAASPTFVPAIHSNSHKKVIEMRTKGSDGNFLVGAMNAANNAEAGNEPELIPNSNPSLEYI